VVYESRLVLLVEETSNLVNLPRAAAERIGGVALPTFGLGWDSRGRFRVSRLIGFFLARPAPFKPEKRRPRSVHNEIGITPVVPRGSPPSLARISPRPPRSNDRSRRTMGGGNAQKSAKARADKAAKAQKAAKGASPSRRRARVPDREGKCRHDLRDGGGGARREPRAATRARRGTPSRTSTRASRPRAPRNSPPLVIPDPSSTRPRRPPPRAQAASSSRTPRR
jgi:hypothetical protein